MDVKKFDWAWFEDHAWQRVPHFLDRYPWFYLIIEQSLISFMLTLFFHFGDTWASPMAVFFMWVLYSVQRSALVMFLEFILVFEAEEDNKKRILTLIMNFCTLSSFFLESRSYLICPLQCTGESMPKFGGSPVEQNDYGACMSLCLFRQILYSFLFHIVCGGLCFGATILAKKLKTQ